MEISSVEFSDAYWEAEEDPPERWKKIGSIAFVVSCALTPAFIPALLKKKRVVTLLCPTIVEEVVAGGEPKPQEKVPALSPEKLDAARKLFGDLATKNSATLGWHKDYYEGLGQTLKENPAAHPFSLLIELNGTFKTIFAGWNPFVRNNVLEGLKEGLVREEQNLLNHTEDLAAKLGKNKEDLKGYILACNWDELITYLFP